jgi:glucose/arabinose dehydrogenase
VRSLLAVVLVAIATVGCGQTGLPSGATTGGNPDNPPEPVGSTPIASGFDRPVWAGSPTGDRRLFVVEQHAARIWTISGAVRAGSPFLTLPEPVAQGNEQGLLGLAFHPDFATNGRFFVDFTNAAGDTRVVEFHATGDHADPTPVRTWLAVDQPYANHNGGNIVFGPDGHLYVGMGDGGAGGDPQNHAQDPSSLLGKLLRLDVDSPGAKPEIWALGLRNPWRFAFAPRSGDLWIGDVGQNAWEEVDHVAGGGTAGMNFGWRLREGTHPYGAGGPEPPRYVAPVFEYAHGDHGCSVTGGEVLADGRYLVGDYCSGQYWAVAASGNAERLAIAAQQPVSFGRDGLGRILIVSGDGTIFRLAA